MGRERVELMQNAVAGKIMEVGGKLNIPINIAREVASLGIAIFIDGTGQPILRPRTAVPEQHFDSEVVETLEEMPDLIQQLNWSGKCREH